jgi:cytochrome c6
MLRPKLSISIILLIGLTLFFCAVQPLYAQDQAAAATYKSKCVICHGADGKGETPIGMKMGVHDFASPEVKKQSDQELVQVITKGKNKMPAYASKLQDPEIKGLVTYIRELAKGK